MRLVCFDCIHSCVHRLCKHERMGDRLERTDVWQQHHDRVTAEIPVIVVSDSEHHDMFEREDDES